MWAAVSCSCTGCTVLCQTAVSRIVHFSKKAPVRLREQAKNPPRVYHATAANVSDV